MTSASAEPQSPLPARPAGVTVPRWVTFVLVSLVVAAGGWLIWSQLYRLRSVDVSQFESNDTPATRARARFMNQMTNPKNTVGAGVLRRADGTGDVHLVGSRARFSREAGVWTANLAFIEQRFIPANDRNAITARFLAITAKSQNIKIDVTDDQVQKLRQLGITNEMEATDAQRKTLIDLWAAYIDAPEAGRAAIEQKLIASLQTIAAAAVEPTLRKTADDAAKIRAILSVEQVAKLGGRRSPTAAAP